MRVARAGRHLSLGSEAVIDRLTAAPAEGNRFFEGQPASHGPRWLIGKFDHHRIAPDFLLERHSLKLDPDPVYLLRPHCLARWQQSQFHRPSGFTRSPRSRPEAEEPAAIRRPRWPRP